MSKKKKFDFSEVFTKDDFKDISENVTLHPSVYAQLYKDLKFPRKDYAMRVSLKKIKPEKKK